MGISKQLHLKGNDFTNASSAFWIAVLIFEFPSSEFDYAAQYFMANFV